MADTERPTSGMRGRVTRRGAAPAEAAAAPEVDGDGGEGDAAWKVEMESIMSGTHPTLVEALKPHEERLNAVIAQADRVRQLQIININALYDCEKKQAADEQVAQLEFFKARLMDGIEEKHKKSQQAQGRGRADAKPAKRVRLGSAAMPTSYQLKPEELKADLEEITTNVDHYSVRSAAVVSDELRSGSSADAWFDRTRQLLHCNGHAFERGDRVFVYTQGQRVDDVWTLTAMNAVEVTLRDADGIKLKVTLAQLRNGRYAFRPAPAGQH